MSTLWVLHGRRAVSPDPAQALQPGALPGLSSVGRGARRDAGGRGADGEAGRAGLCCGTHPAPRAGVLTAAGGLSAGRGSCTACAWPVGSPRRSRPPGPQQDAFKCPELWGWRRSKSSSVERAGGAGGMEEASPESCHPAPGAGHICPPQPVSPPESNKCPRLQPHAGKSRFPANTDLGFQSGLAQSEERAVFPAHLFALTTSGQTPSWGFAGRPCSKSFHLPEAWKC